MLSPQDISQLAELRRGAVKNDSASIKQVAEKFEALFVQQLFKNLRAETADSDSIMDNAQSKMYRSMYDQKISETLAKGKMLGLSGLIEKQLNPGQSSKGEIQATQPEQVFFPLENYWTHHHKQPISLDSNSSQPKSVTMQPTVAATTVSNSTPPTGNIDKKAEFVEMIWPLAEKAGKQLGVDPKVLVAQSVLETGWGQHMMQQSDQSTSNNLFGIKTNRHWQGEKVTVSSLEFIDQIPQKKMSNFKVYQDFSQSFHDYVDLVTNSPRYQPALEQAGNAENYIQSLQDSGYATDPKYGEKIISIMNSPRLNSILASQSNPSQLT